MLPVSQQIFIQQILKNNYIPVETAIAKLKAIHEQLPTIDQGEQINLEQINEKFLKKTIQEINKMIKHQKLKISITRCEITSKIFVILFSTSHNEITETQTFYSQHELDYWLPVMDEIIKADTKSLNQIGCMNLVSEKKLSIKLDEAEDFLGKCVKNGYLVHKVGQYYLGSKALLEFNNDLRTTYKDYIMICKLCSELCCHGKTCVNCNKLMHEHCLNTILATSQDCPLCHVRWGDFDFEHNQNSLESCSEDDEEMADVSQDSVRSTRSRSTRRGTRSRNK